MPLGASKLVLTGSSMAKSTLEFSTKKPASVLRNSGMDSMMGSSGNSMAMLTGNSANSLLANANSRDSMSLGNSIGINPVENSADSLLGNSASLAGSSSINPSLQSKVDKLFNSMKDAQPETDVTEDTSDNKMETKSASDLKTELFGDENLKEDVILWKRLCSIGGLSVTFINDLNNLWETGCNLDGDQCSKKKTEKTLQPIMMIKLKALVATASAILRLAKSEIPEAGCYEAYQIPSGYDNAVTELRSCESFLIQHKKQACTKEDKAMVEMEIDEYITMQKTLDEYATAILLHLVPGLHEIVDDVKTFASAAGTTPRMAKEYMEHCVTSRFGHLKSLDPEVFKQLQAHLSDEELKKRRTGGGGKLKRKSTLD